MVADEEEVNDKEEEEPGSHGLEEGDEDCDNTTIVVAVEDGRLLSLLYWLRFRTTMVGVEWIP